MKRTPVGAIWTIRQGQRMGTPVWLFIVVMIIVLMMIATLQPDAREVGESAGAPPFAPLQEPAEVFSASIRAAARVHPQSVSGITVPHHLLAADLIASGFRIASGGRYDKIVMLTPDHFKKTRSPFATTPRDFQTVFGLVKTRQADVAALMRHADLIERSDLFEKEHGLGALLPYVRHHFPNVEIVPIAISLKASQEQLEQLVSALDPLITERTLIIQSTDFSHYLSQPEAVAHDQTVLNLLAAGDAAAIPGLIQPSHLDSRGAQYVQMRMQEKHFGARPVVVANSNSQAYIRDALAETTSYIVQVYPTAVQARVADANDVPGSQRYCFVGDTAFSRHLLPILADRAAADRIRADLASVLNGCPLILNLEGVVVPELPTNLGPLTLAMPSDLTLRWLKDLNVVAVSVANNHAMDLGDAPFHEMVRILTAAGIRVLQHGEIVDLGPFRIVALTDLNNTGDPQTDLIGAKELNAIAQSTAAPPLFAFLHWGQEYAPGPGEREEFLADELRRRAVSLIVGAHPHRASTSIEAPAGGEAQVVHSLGNFLFDQRADRVSGRVLEVRMFEQGTFFTRLLPVPNVYKESRRLR